MVHVQPRGNPTPGACSSTGGQRCFSPPSPPKSGIWHILLTCTPFEGGVSNALAVFTRRGPTPGAHSLKIWRSCARSFRGSPLACLFPRGTGTRGAAAVSGAKTATTPGRTSRARIPAPPRGIEVPSSVPRWGTRTPPPPVTASPCIDFQFSRGFSPGPCLPWALLPWRLRI